MTLFVLIKSVVDTVEELFLRPDGKGLDGDSARYKINDSDDHAVEQAILLKERYGGHVVVLALDAPEVDDVLFGALARGADRAAKIPGSWVDAQSRTAARAFAEFLLKQADPLPADALVLTRAQAPDEIGGEIGPVVSEMLGVPYLGVVTAVSRTDGGITAVKEFSGGWRGEFTLPLPAVLGIQSAEKPPRYVPIARLRAVMKSALIEEVPVSTQVEPVAVERMYKPETAGRAQMIEGPAHEVADRILGVLAEKNLV